MKWIASNSQLVYDRPHVFDMPPTYDHSMIERTIEEVSTLKSFLKSCLELMKDETSLNTLRGMIDQCTQDREPPSVRKVLIQVQRKKRINREFRLTAQVEDYDMDNISLDLGSDVNVILK
jgi:hypothetical protein